MPSLLRSALVAAAALHADRLRLDHRFPLVVVAAARPYGTAAAGVAALVMAAHRPTRPLAGVLAASAAAALPGLVRRARARPLAVEHATDVTILAANVWHGRADTGAMATLLERRQPDLVALSEAGHDYRDKLMPLIEAMGYRSWVSTLPGQRDGAGTVLLAGPRAGELTVTSGPELRRRHLRATGGMLGSRSLLIAHTAAPDSPLRVSQWRSDLGYLARWSREPVTPIIAGDLNATLDHRLLRRLVGPCRSAADGTGQGLVATYPSHLPRWAGIHIDHVFVPAAAEVTRYEIVDLPGSDHRGILTRVRLPAS